MYRTTIKGMFFSFICLFATINFCNAQRDTTIYYFRSQDMGNGFTSVMRVNTLAESDFFRMVYPSETFHHYVVNEFYSNGKIKLIGNTIPGIDPHRLSLADIAYDGDFASYYPTGKKESLVHYINGVKNGDEYLFYPNGKVYCYMKNSPHKQWNTQFNFSQEVTKSLLMECYDKNGNMICQDGNGEWISYTKDFDKIVMRGPVKNGSRDGKWYGNTLRADSIKYTYVYKKGDITEQVGYDKLGTAYPFDEISQRADCAKGDVFSFMASIRNHLKLPAGQDNLNIDTMHVSFIIEKDGSLTDFHVVGDWSPEVKDAFANALKPNKTWTPAKYYGVPFRTLMIMPFYVYRNTTTTQQTYYNTTNMKPERSQTTNRSKSMYGYQKMLDFDAFK